MIACRKPVVIINPSEESITYGRRDSSYFPSFFRLGRRSITADKDEPLPDACEGGYYVKGFLHGMSVPKKLFALTKGQFNPLSMQAQRHSPSSLSNCEDSCLYQQSLSFDIPDEWDFNVVVQPCQCMCHYSACSLESTWGMLISQVAMKKVWMQWG